MDKYYLKRRQVVYAEQFNPDGDNDLPLGICRTRDGYFQLGFTDGPAINPGEWLIWDEPGEMPRQILSPQAFADLFEAADDDNAEPDQHAHLLDGDLKQPRTILPAGTIVKVKGWPLRLVHAASAFGIVPVETDATNPVYPDGNPDDELITVMAEDVELDAVEDAVLDAVTAMLIAEDLLLSLLNPQAVQILRQELVRDGELRMMLPDLSRVLPGGEG